MKSSKSHQPEKAAALHGGATAAEEGDDDGDGASGNEQVHPRLIQVAAQDGRHLRHAKVRHQGVDTQAQHHAANDLNDRDR